MNFEPFALASANSRCTLPCSAYIIFGVPADAPSDGHSSKLCATRHASSATMDEGNFVFGWASMSAAPEPSAVAVAAQRRPIREIVAYLLRLGTLGFGGPVALCGLMEKESVGKRGWLTKEEMRDAIAVSQALPGPLA